MKFARTLDPAKFVVSSSMCQFVVVFTVAVCITISACVGEATDAERLFAVRVLPLLKAKCFSCHGDDADDVNAELDVRSRATMLEGGESGEPALVPGKPEASLLYSAIKWEDYEMPPKENDRLTDEQIQWVRQWIAAGAPWPDQETITRYRKESWQVDSADGILIATSGGLSDEWTYRRYQPEDVWAFQPLKKVKGGKTTADGRHPIDCFVARKQTDAGVEAAPQADPATLIRRATFDLIGLPPEPQEVNDFVAAWKNDSERAWSDLVDRLLASPHYGERWGQHWLDVARYSDTGGYSNDYERSNMWRYRDYVIRSLNDDKPYNQFIIEQLAGDEVARMQEEGGRMNDMPPATFNVPPSELLVATGFLRMGPWDPAMVLKDEARQIYIDDVVNAVGQTFLSTTMRCFKCHDHKFDPLPTRDYYGMYAALAATQLAERPAPFLPTENRKGFKEGRAMVQQLLEFATQRKDELENKKEAAARQWFEEHDLPYVPEDDRKKLPDEVKPPRYIGLDPMEQGRMKVRNQDEWIWTRRLERYRPIAQSVYNGPDPKKLNARKLRMPKRGDRNWKLDTHILMGGSLQAPGEKVSPGVLSAIGPLIGPPALAAGVEQPTANPKESEASAFGSQDRPPNGTDPFRLPEAAERRRLALAKWIADPRNPLTTRSIVNRAWQYHFGKPIAGNPNNFGAKGAKPTHPELLDWLAADFVENGWTLKRLHKLIMTSAAYQQSARHPSMEKLRHDDPNNDLLAYFPTRRLSAEELRDSILKITGELNPALGGLPVMPEMNMEVALQPRMIQFSLAPAYQPSRTPDQRNRRSIYAYRVRGQADPFLEVFNQPNANESCDLRDAASVSPQVFTLLNSDVMTDRSIAFALRLTSEADSVEQQVKLAFSLALGREASAAEQQRMTEYVRAMGDYHRGVQPEPVTYQTSITRSLVEELSGKPFQYDEILPVFENYVPDKKPADVNAQTRALADLCLLLFNSNEFAFVY